jgi:hypothetical protein
MAVSLELSSIQHNRGESARLAQAMAEYERRGGRVQQGTCFTGTPIPPKRRDWVDPETVLKRKTRNISPAGRKQLRQMAEAL